jgi:hypothetical protein
MIHYRDTPSLAGLRHAIEVGPSAETRLRVMYDTTIDTLFTVLTTAQFHLRSNEPLEAKDCKRAHGEHSC